MYIWNTMMTELEKSFVLILYLSDQANQATGSWKVHESKG